MSKWRECRLGELLSVKHGWAFKSECFSEEEITGPILVSIGNFQYNGGFRFDTTKLKRYLCQYPKEYELEPGDILLIMTCQTEGGEILGIPGIIPNDQNIYLHNQRLGKIEIKDKSIIDAKFLYWFFLSYEFNQALVASATGTKILHTAPNRIENVLISLPPITEQKAIAEVLSSLDDKINLLYSQNKTIEELTQTLFRQWLIKEDDDWKEVPLTNIASFLNGLACQKFPPENDYDKLPVLKIKDLKSGISDSSDWATSNVKPEYIVQNGDVVFAWSASLMVKIWDGEQCVLNQHLFKVTSEKYPKWFYYQWCKMHLDDFIAISSAHATTMGHIKRNDLENAMCSVPTDVALESMNEQMFPLMEKMENNSKQINTLVNMRDALLPKLLSGEVRVEK